MILPSQPLALFSRNQAGDGACQHLIDRLASQHSVDHFLAGEHMLMRISLRQSV
jgi:hypothetical protein